MDKAACLGGRVIAAVECRTNSVSNLSPPRVVKIPEPQTIQRGSSLKIRCSITGPASTQFYWIRRDIDGYLTSSSLSGVSINNLGTSLSIVNASSKHEGVYECLAINSAGFETINYQLTVQGMLEIFRFIFLNEYCYL